MTIKSQKPLIGIDWQAGRQGGQQYARRPSLRAALQPVTVRLDNHKIFHPRILVTTKQKFFLAFSWVSHWSLTRILAGAAGFEPATYGFGDRRSTSWAIPLHKMRVTAFDWMYQGLEWKIIHTTLVIFSFSLSWAKSKGVLLCMFLLALYR